MRPCIGGLVLANGGSPASPAQSVTQRAGSRIHLSGVLYTGADQAGRRGDADLAVCQDRGQYRLSVICISPGECAPQSQKRGIRRRGLTSGFVLKPVTVARPCWSCTSFHESYARILLPNPRPTRSSPGSRSCVGKRATAG